jgi:hypothetical protein
VERVIQIAHQAPAPDDGVEYRANTVSSRIIRDEALYSGVRIAMDCAIATAIVKFRLDVNFGDPVTPAPRELSLPSLRPGIPPIRVLGYPIETVLAEKITTAIGLGPANTRVRDYADIYTLTRTWPVDHGTTREALLATAAFRGTTLAALSSAVDNLADLRQQTYAAYRVNIGTAGENLPVNFGEVVEAVIAFADALESEAPEGTTWHPRISRSGRRRHQR